MKGFLQKELRRLYVVTAPHFEDQHFDVSRNTLDQSFQGWLHALEATEEQDMASPAVVINNDLRLPVSRAQKRGLQLCKPLETQPTVSSNTLSVRPAKLTTQDYVQVMMVTIREGHRHARWPKDVLAHFLAAEVISE